MIRRTGNALQTNAAETLSKAALVKAFEPPLKMAVPDIEALWYVRRTGGREFVYIDFRQGGRLTMDISRDSAEQVIRDILGALQ